MENDNLVYLRHIYDELLYLLDVAKRADYETFVSNPDLLRGVVQSLEIIGEASKKLSKEYRDAHQDILWDEMTGMRDVLIHRYFGVDTVVVWDTVIPDIPVLYKQISELLPD